MSKVKIQSQKHNVGLQSGFSLSKVMKNSIINNPGDKKVVLMSVKHTGVNLEYASDELKDNKEIVLEAVKNDGRAISFASDRLKKDKDILLASLKSSYFKKTSVV